MKFAHITILSLLLLAVYTAAKRLPTHEVLPTPILIHAVKGNPNKYIVENVWYGNGYEDDDKVTAVFKCEAPVKVNATDQPKIFNDRRAFFELTVPDSVKTVKCRRGIFDIDSFRFSAVSFPHTK
ncbi:8698_t:CDS:2 [Paraglomus brasilianum]|uniref:8698_t:CDS:1 n=1 Tax=Paraglomus brasilianum TaxID=144538 RepID=A0A9N8ZYW0_9GLOM|nr:8698_t:CDS:2 [Paraglomus brasilianum]